MQLRLEKCQVIVPERVHYQKAIGVLVADDSGGSARLEVYNRRERLLETITAPYWRKLPGSDWELYDDNGRIAYLEITGGCNCGGTSTTQLTAGQGVS
jgi:hypothetical protein